MNRSICSRCGDSFIPIHKFQAYCTHRCRKRAERSRAKKRNLLKGIKINRTELGGKYLNFLRKNCKTYFKNRNIRQVTRRKKIEKVSCCWCGSTEELFFHHWNYDKPFEVDVLCSDCHYLADKIKDCFLYIISDIVKEEVDVE